MNGQSGVELHGAQRHTAAAGTRDRRSPDGEDAALLPLVEDVLGQDGPTHAVENKLPRVHLGRTRALLILSVIEVVGKYVTRRAVRVGIGPDVRMTRADEAAVRLQKHRPTTFRHVVAVPIKVGTAWMPGTSHTYFVRTLDAAAAAPPVHEQIIVVLTVPVDIRRLNLAGGKPWFGDRLVVVLPQLRGHAVKRLVVGAPSVLACAGVFDVSRVWIQLDDMDSRPM